MLLQLVFFLFCVYDFFPFCGAFHNLLLVKGLMGDGNKKGYNLTFVKRLMNVVLSED